MKRTYIDANVLIAAFQGESAVAKRAFMVLDDPNRALVISEYLRLEVLPKPTFHNHSKEVEFMEAVLGAAAEKVSTSDLLAERAVELACRYNMKAMDALHVGSAVLGGVDELVTMEKPTRPICKVAEIRVVSIHSNSEAD